MSVQVRFLGRGDAFASGRFSTCFLVETVAASEDGRVVAL